MTSRITPIEIGFGLDDPSAQPLVVDPVQQCFADQLAGDDGGRPIKE